MRRSDPQTSVHSSQGGFEVTGIQLRSGQRRIARRPSERWVMTCLVKRKQTAGYERATAYFPLNE